MIPLEIKAPFTDEQVTRLNERQNNELFHPYTCNRGYTECEVHEGDLSKDGTLIATTGGWVCPCGKYTQNWAHATN